MLRAPKRKTFLGSVAAVALMVAPVANANAWVWLAIQGAWEGAKLAKKAYEKNQLDRIEAKQTQTYGKQVVTLKALHDTLKQAKDMRDKIERFDAAAERSKKRAETLMKLLKEDKKKVAATYFERAVGMPINPGYYVPNTKWSKKMKRNMDCDLLGPKISWRERMVLSDSTSDVLRNMRTMPSLPENTADQLDASEAYNQAVLQALDAKSVVRAKRYQSELDRLAQEIAAYEKRRSSDEKISATELYALEQMLETKRMALNRLENLLDESLRKGLTPSKSDRDAFRKKHQRETYSQMIAFMNEEKKRMRG